MLVPHLLKIYFGLGWPSSVLEIVSSQRLKKMFKDEKQAETKPSRIKCKGREGKGRGGEERVREGKWRGEKERVREGKENV